MSAIGLFPNHIERVERVIFIAFLTVCINRDLPTKAGFELVRTVKKHRARQFGISMKIVGIDIADHLEAPFSNENKRRITLYG